jgi:hypothetical protein
VLGHLPSPAAPKPAPADSYPGTTLAASFLASVAVGFGIAGNRTVLGGRRDEKNALGEAGQIMKGFTGLDTASEVRDPPAAGDLRSSQIGAGTDASRSGPMGSALKPI